MSSVFKKLVLIGLVGLLAFGLSGCSSSQKSTSQAVTLYWWRSKEDASQEVLEAMAKEFEANNSNVKIQIVLKDPRTFEDEATAALAAHATVQNAPDVLSVRAEDMPKYALQLTPAADNLFDSQQDKKKQTGETTLQYVQNLFEPAAVKAVLLNEPGTGQAKIYGLPLAIDDLALYLNTDLISKAADNLKAENKITKEISSEELNILKKKINTAPTTWQQLVEVLPYLTLRQGENISRSGIAMGTSKNVERSYDILSTIMMQNGTKLTSDDLNQATFNLAQTGATGQKNPGLQALKFYLSFSDPNSPNYTWNNNMPNSVQAFEQGQVAMMIHYASIYRFIINEAPAIKKVLDVKPIPQIADPNNPVYTQSKKTMASMWVETVPSAKADSTRQQAAWNFVYYITSKKGSASYLSAMKLPSALKDQLGKAKFEAFSTQKTFADLWFKGHKALDVNKTFIQMIEQCTAPNSRNEACYQKALDQAATTITTYLQASKIKWATAAATTSQTSTSPTASKTATKSP